MKKVSPRKCKNEIYRKFTSLNDKINISFFRKYLLKDLRKGETLKTKPTEL